MDKSDRNRKEETPQSATLRSFDKSLPMALLRSRERIMRGFKGIIQRHELSEQQWRILRALAEFKRLEAGQIAEVVLLHKPSVTRILQTLERRSLIKKKRHSGDRRYVYVELTEQGQSIFDELSPLSEMEYRRIEKSLGANELKQLYELLNRLEETVLDDS